MAATRRSEHKASDWSGEGEGGDLSEFGALPDLRHWSLSPPTLAHLIHLANN